MTGINNCHYTFSSYLKFVKFFLYDIYTKSFLTSFPGDRWPFSRYDKND